MLHETHKNERIFTFNKFSSWKKHILELHQKCIKDGKKLIILSELSKYPLHGLNLKYVIVYNFLKKNLIDYYEFNNAGIKSPKATTGTYLKYFKVFRYWRYVIMRLNELFTSFFGNLLNLKPKGIFVAGNQAKKKLEYFKKTKGIELIDFNTWEFSSTINQRNNDKNSFDSNILILLLVVILILFLI